MKTSQNFTIIYILLAVAQMVICNYFRISPYIYVTILPAMVLCIPLKTGTPAAMLAAFGTGISVDLLAEGVLGLNTLALVPVALIRFPVLKMLMGTEMQEKNYRLTMRSAGIWKMLMAAVICNALFLAVYVIADGAGARPFWFNAIRFGASLVCDSILALLVIHVLNPEER